MENRMKYYTISLETIGPLFVGTGERYQKSEYILDSYSKTFYVMDTLKMFNGLKKINLLTEYEKWVLSQPKNVNLFNFVKENNIKAGEYSKWAKYRFEVPNAAELRNADVLPVMKDAYNMPYIPGSSIKGAIRNAILNSELINSDDMADTARRAEMAVNSFNGRRTQYLAREASEIDEKLFHTLCRKDEKGKEIKASNAVNSIFQGLRISDSKPVSINSVALYQKIDMRPDGTVNKLNILRECVKPNTRIDFTAEIDTAIFPYSVEDMIRCVNDMYENEQEKFLMYFPNTQKSSGNLIYVGGGSGFITKTAVYSLFHDKKQAVKNASVILDNTDSTNKGRKVGKHLEDPSKYGTSPHMKKTTVSGTTKHEFGLCRLDISERAF